jgi:hypothetical protein
LRNIDLLPIPVVLTAPENEEHLDSVFPEFDWHHAPMVGTPSHYRLLVSLSSDMSNPVMDVLIRYPQAHYKVSLSEPLLPNTRYFWMIVSQNNFGPSRNNVTRRFTTGEYSPVYIEVIEHLELEQTPVERETVREIVRERVSEPSKVKVYFDISAGWNNYISHKYAGDQLKDDEYYDGSDFGFELGGRLGFALGDLPAYLSVEFAIIERKVINKFDLFDDSKNEIVSNYTQYYIAPGLVYYPINNLQLAGSFGFSFGKYRSRFEIMDFDETFDIKTGIAYKFSVGYDIFGKRDSAIVGVSIFNAHNDIAIFNTTEDFSTTTVGLFLKYRFRSR